MSTATDGPDADSESGPGVTAGVGESAGSWRPYFVAALAALGTIAGADALIQRVQPLFPPLRHVHEGVAEFRASAPTTLVLGSSHARSFDAVGAALEARTRGRHHLVTVPVEMGGFQSFRWVLEHRLAPLIDERDVAALPRRPVRNLILVTTFFDACSVDVTRGDLNLPARAWTFADFVQHLLRSGITDQGRTYLRERWKQLFPASVLVQDRGAFNIAGALKRLVRPESEADHAAWARANLEEQFGWCRDEREIAALAAIADFAAARELDLTVVLFPLAPDIVTEKARRTTLAWYAEQARRLSTMKGFRVLDLTSAVPLDHHHFAPDLDHLTAEGNRRFAEWVLARDLQYLEAQP